MPETCRFNASKYGKRIAAPTLCSPWDDNACRAANSSHELHGAFACCSQTAETLLQIGVRPSFISEVRDSILNSLTPTDNPLQPEANLLRAQGITKALEEA